MYSTGKHFSLSKAADILQVKRVLLLTLEQHFPELHDCMKRSGTERYTSYEFAFLQSIVRKINLEQLPTNQLTKAKLNKILNNLGESHAAHQQKDEEQREHKPVSSDDISKTAKPKSSKVKTLPITTSDPLAGEYPSQWYYDKLYSQFHGQQKTLNFEDPSKFYTSANIPQKQSNEDSKVDDVKPYQEKDTDREQPNDNMNLLQKLDKIELLIKHNKIDLTTESGRDLSAILPLSLTRLSRDTKG